MAANMARDAKGVYCFDCGKPGAKRHDGHACQAVTLKVGKALKVEKVEKVALALPVNRVQVLNLAKDSQNSRKRTGSSKPI